MFTKHTYKTYLSIEFCLSQIELFIDLVKIFGFQTVDVEVTIYGLKAIQKKIT